MHSSSQHVWRRSFPCLRHTSQYALRVPYLASYKSCHGGTPKNGFPTHTPAPPTRAFLGAAPIAATRAATSVARGRGRLGGCFIDPISTRVGCLLRRRGPATRLGSGRAVLLRVGAFRGVIRLRARARTCCRRGQPALLRQANGGPSGRRAKVPPTQVPVRTTRRRLCAATGPPSRGPFARRALSP